MFELEADDPIIKDYLKNIQHLKSQQLIEHELGLKGPFQNMLDKAARKRGWDAGSGALNLFRRQARGAGRDGPR